jgi:hypothetical protein
MTVIYIEVCPWLRYTTICHRKTATKFACSWVRRVKSQPGFLHEVHAYSIDPKSGQELA